MPPWLCCVVTTRAVGLLEDARRGAHERRFDHPGVLDDLVDATVDRAGEAASQLSGDQHLAEGVRERQPQQLQIVLAEQIHISDRGAGVHPRLVTQPHPFGAAGGPRGVNQRRQPVGRDLLGDRAHAGGMLGQILRALVGEVIQGDHPVAVTGSVEHHDLGQVGQVSSALGELLQLGVVFGEDDPRFGVGEDVGGVFGVGARVDGGRRRAGAHDRQVGQDPLEPSRRGDPDPILGCDAQRQQSGCQGLHPFGRLLPGDRGPVAVGGVSEGFLVS